MTNYYVTYTFKDKEARTAFYDEVVANGIDQLSRAEDGCGKYAYFYPADSENELFLWEQWESRDHQKAHTMTEHFAKLGKLKEKYNVEAAIIVED